MILGEGSLVQGVSNLICTSLNLYFKSASVCNEQSWLLLGSCSRFGRQWVGVSSCRTAVWMTKATTEQQGRLPSPQLTLKNVRQKVMGRSSSCLCSGFSCLKCNSENYTSKLGFFQNCLIRSGKHPLPHRLPHIFKGNAIWAHSNSHLQLK